MNRGRERMSIGQLALVGGMMLVMLSCADQSGSPGPRSGAPSTDPEFGNSASINLTYACGNRFVISNARRVPITVTYRVVGSGEEGTADLAAAPRMDPAITEQTVEVRTSGAVELYLNGRHLVTRDNGGAPCSAESASAPALATLSGSQAGSWSAPFSWPIVAIHMVLLPDQRILSLGRTGDPQVWDPASGKFTAVPSPAWLFCAGQAVLPDGRVLFAGGHIDYDYGLPNTTVFDPATTSWISSALMARGRWYPTATTLANGDVLIVAGRDQESMEVTLPEVWSKGAIRQLTTASRVLPYYPRMFLTSKGTVFVAGSPVASRYVVTTGTGAWKGGPKHVYASARDYGAAVMYEQGKILYAGGARTTNTAEVIDLDAATPAWNWTGSMSVPRRHLNLTVLPTGEVLATGGVGGTKFNDPTKAVYTAELWNPATGQWTVLSSNQIMRDYHGTALLLPDGRVLVAGGSESAGTPNQKNAEIFSPPYLFRGARPTIASAPATLRYGQSFQVGTPNASSIAKVSLIRLGAVTHAFDQNSRRLKLTFSVNATGLTVIAPSTGNIAPPGHYMLFIVNGTGVPSVARIVKIS
ncbi:MAG TPA: galactose oxidase-like domain-containing protein [Gemmatimonadales bacterium]|nr:galactose oxidase-like domain-containing protein [Gemmatimonadales bacterium]